MTHYHYGHGLAGYGPEEPTLCLTLDCLSYDVRTELDGIAECWGDQAYGERTHVENLRKERPASGSDPIGYSGSWESIADAAMRALECLDKAEEAQNLAFNLRPDRAKAPLYQGNPEAWQAELQRLLIDGSTYPLDTTIDGNVRFYVWSCETWQCLLNEHDQGYTVPPQCPDGGYVPCACLDCMEITVWSPSTGEAPYCADCAQADCANREYPYCLTESDDV